MSLPLQHRLGRLHPLRLLDLSAVLLLRGNTRAEPFCELGVAAVATVLARVCVSVFTCSTLCFAVRESCRSPQVTGCELQAAATSVLCVCFNEGERRRGISRARLSCPVDLALFSRRCAIAARRCLVAAGPSASKERLPALPSTCVRDWGYRSSVLQPFGCVPPSRRLSFHAVVLERV